MEEASWDLWIGIATVLIALIGVVLPELRAVRRSHEDAQRENREDHKKMRDENQTAHDGIAKRIEKLGMQIDNLRITTRRND